MEVVVPATYFRFRTRQRFAKARKERLMQTWFWYAIVAAILYGLHQVFTKLAAPHIGDGLGGFVVEITAALTIALYLGWLWMSGKWDQKADSAGVLYCVLTGLCVGVGTIAFFMLFQKGGPLSAVPMVLAGGAALMALIGILFLEEPASSIRLVGITLSILGLFLLRYSPTQ
jgi:bacterial/archaeal transporter family protein